MFASKKNRFSHLTIVSSLLALGAIHCNLVTAPAGLGATSVSSQGLTETVLVLQPEAAWVANGGGINAVCAAGANPREASFTQVGGGVSLSAVSDRADCCTCTGRSRIFPVGSTPVAGSRVRGTLITSRGTNDQYAVASMRVTLKLGSTVVGSKILAGEDRPNNNCAGSSERPELIVNGAFDVDLSSFAPSANGASFDEVDVDLMGYACGDASSQATLESLEIVSSSNGSVTAPTPTTPAPAPTTAPTPTTPAPAPTTAPTPTPAPAGTPNLASMITPGSWGAYASGTIGKDNAGIATITNKGTASAAGVTVDIHTESNNPYGPVAPFRMMDPRCISASPGNNAYTCLLGSLAAGDATNIDFTFNSFSDTTVVVIAKDTNGDVDFSDNRAVGHVYPL